MISTKIRIVTTPDGHRVGTHRDRDLSKPYHTKDGARMAADRLQRLIDGAEATMWARQDRIDREQTITSP